MTIDYGNDESSFAPDGTLSMGFDRPQITGVRVVLESCVRTIMTPIGTNSDGSPRGLFYDTTIGVITTVQALFNATPTDADLRRTETDWSTACVTQVKWVTAARWRIVRDTVTGKLMSVIGTIDVQGSGTQIITGTLDGTAADALAFLFTNAG